MTSRVEADNQTGRVTTDYDGRLAQLVERTLSMREVGGWKPTMSNILGNLLHLTNTTGEFSFSFIHKSVCDSHLVWG